MDDPIPLLPPPLPSPIKNPSIWHLLPQKVIFLLVVALFLIYSLLNKYDSYEWQINEVLYATTNDHQSPTTPTDDTKYITHSMGPGCICCGLGNMMFRFASISGIAKVINRQPFVLSSVKCMHGAKKEAEGIFPEYAKRIHFIVRRGLKG
jgi:hypothetical protein